MYKSPAFFNRTFFSYLLIVFLNAFIDIGHKILIQNTIFKVYTGAQQIILAAIVNGLILLPFILFFSLSGYCSDKYNKVWIMRVAASSAVLLTVLITFFYYLGWFYWAFAMTFILALQSAFFSPAKYGYIREHYSKQRLLQANGFLQATTMIAILGSLFCFSILFEYQLSDLAYLQTTTVLKDIAPTGWVLVLLSLMQCYLTFQMPLKSRYGSKIYFSWKAYLGGKYLKDNLQYIWSVPIILISIIGLGIFWSISQVMIAVFPAYAKENMAIDNTVIIQGLLACAGMGIMLGSMLAAYGIEHKQKSGLIPLGMLGVFFCLLILPFLQTQLWLHGFNFLCWGICAGFVIVPFNTLIQDHAQSDQLGRVIAGSNFIQNSLMLSALIITILLSYLALDSLLQLRLLMFIALFSGLIAMCYFMRQLLYIAISRILLCCYRVHTQGLKHVPETGGVLLLGNHVSWLDWGFIQIAVSRPIHFVIWRGFYQRWYLKWFLDLFHVLPISSRGSHYALKHIADYLDQGKVVCIFPESMISYSAQMNTFHHGYQQIIGERKDIKIIPFYLGNLWGSRFSRAGQRLKAQYAGLGRHKVIVVFGTPKRETQSPEELRAYIMELSIDAWNIRADMLPTLGSGLISALKRHPFQGLIADFSVSTMRSSTFLAIALYLSTQIRKTSAGKNIGILLPSSVASFLINVAAIIAGKTIINLNFTASNKSLASAIAQSGITEIYTSHKFMQRYLQNNDNSPFLGLHCIAIEDQLHYFNLVNKFAFLGMSYLLPSWLLKYLFLEDVDTSSTAAILFSSGSEGAPKGVMLGHRQLMIHIEQIAAMLNVETDDRMLSVLPPFHAFGLTVTTLMPLMIGLPVVCDPDPSNALSNARIIARHRLTLLCTTPSFLRLYIQNQHVHSTMLQSLRLVITGSEKLSVQIREAFTLKFAKEIFEGYGATETAPVVSCNMPDICIPDSDRIQNRQRFGTVGMPIPGTIFRIVDPQSLAVKTTGDDGLVLIAGVQLMQAYLKDSVKTEAAFIQFDGRTWYRSGDNGYLDKDGFLTIVDRYARFAKIRGEMISLGAVEQYIVNILQDEGKTNFELLAVSLPDTRRGEQIVVLLTEDITCKFLRKKMLAQSCVPLMLPSSVLVVASIPKLGSGKVALREAKQQALKLLGWDMNAEERT